MPPRVAIYPYTILEYIVHYVFKHFTQQLTCVSQQKVIDKDVFYNS